MEVPTLLLLAAVPALPLLAGFAARQASPKVAGQLASAAGTSGVILAVALAALEIFQGPRAGDLLRWDLLATIMTLLVSFLGTVVVRFSRNYLSGDPKQASFFSWMSLTLGCVLLLVTANHLLVLSAAWLGASLCLHQLLLFQKGRAATVFAARKKFVFSRAADLCLLTAAVLLYKNHGSWRLDEIFASIEAGNTTALDPAAFLMAACAVLKTAQFPFHSWLPDTMDTPTPVSAFMHAGIVNAGGFLLVRMAPILVHAPAVLATLAVLGTITAAFGAIIMLPQPGVKRALACSTIAQMGFMILQCGLGAWGLAILHLVAHSLYKAHAFLNAGSTIGAVPRVAIPLKTPALVAGVLLGGFFVTLAATAFHLILPESAHGGPVFAAILALALAYGMARTWSAGAGLSSGLKAVAVGAGLALLGLALHHGADRLLAEPVAPAPPALLLGFIAAVFVSLFLFQALLWRANAHPLGRTLYVHALNGFYVSTMANRLLGRLWPAHPTA